MAMNVGSEDGEEEVISAINTTPLVDVMLVFICGLIAVLFSINPEFKQQLKQQQEIKQGQEMPELPQGFGEAGSGFENVGTVYRDPKTGKLIMVGSETQ